MIIVSLVGLWTLLAVWYGSIPGTVLPLIAVLAYIISCCCVFKVKSRRTAYGLFMALFGIVLLWHLSISPSNDRNWLPLVERLPSSVFSADGDSVIVQNVRNAVYRSRDDFDLYYEDRRYALDEIEGVDFLISYWGNTSIAHTFVSFAFKNNEHLAVSIEIRPEYGETYSPLAGLFKQYEIYYAVGDEKDIIGHRTNYRMEDVYLFESSASPLQARRLFIDMMDKINQLSEEADFYGTIRQNCTTSLVRHVNVILEDEIPFSGRLLLNGFSDELAYSKGLVKSSLPFQDLKAASYISDVARRGGLESDFSTRLRKHVRRSIEQSRQPQSSGSPGH